MFIAMNLPMTVRELYRFTKIQMDKWNWEKHIFISSDDEGNDVHWLYYQFSDFDPDDWYKETVEDAGCKLEDSVLLG